MYTPFIQTFTWGADYKLTNSDLFFLGGLPDGSSIPIPVNQKLAALFQFYLGYKIYDSWEKLSLYFQLDTFTSPFRFFPHQTKVDYNSLRPGANVRYFYAKAAFGGT